MATCSSLAWRIPWTEEPGRLQRVAKSQTQLSEHAHTVPLHILSPLETL